MLSRTWLKKGCSSRLGHDYDFFLSAFIPSPATMTSKPLFLVAGVWTRDAAFHIFFSP